MWKGSLEVTFFHLSVRIELWDTSYDHICGLSGLEVNQKWTGTGSEFDQRWAVSEPEVECEGSTFYKRRSLAPYDFYKQSTWLQPTSLF